MWRRTSLGRVRGRRESSVVFALWELRLLLQLRLGRAMVRWWLLVWLALGLCGGGFSEWLLSSGRVSEAFGALLCCSSPSRSASPAPSRAPPHPMGAQARRRRPRAHMATVVSSESARYVRRGASARAGAVRAAGPPLAPLYVWSRTSRRSCRRSYSKWVLYDGVGSVSVWSAKIACAIS